MTQLSKQLKQLMRDDAVPMSDAWGKFYDSLLAAEAEEPVAWEVKGILCHTLDEANGYVGQPEPLYAAPQPVAVPDDESESEMKWRDLALQFDGHRMQSLCFLKYILSQLPETEFVEAREFLKSGPLPGEEVLRNRITAMLKAEPVTAADAIDSNLIEALRLVQCMLEDYRERNYGDAERWIRHIDTHMSDYSEVHGDDAYSVLHDLLPAAPAVPEQEV